MELLAVMAIIIVILGLVLPALIGSLNGSQLTQASQQVVRQLDSARQSALSQNRRVEVRFYKYTDSNLAASYRAFQAYMIGENNAYRPLTAIQKLPSTIILNTSTALTSFIGPAANANVTETSSSATDVKPSNLPATYSYFAFQFRPDGSTSLVNYSSVDANNPKLWYFTLSNQTAVGTPPSNYATVQIDPNNGDLRLYRP